MDAVHLQAFRAEGVETGEDTRVAVAVETQGTLEVQLGGILILRGSHRSSIEAVGSSSPPAARV